MLSKSIQDRHFTDFLAPPSSNRGTHSTSRACKHKVKREVVDNPILKKQQCLSNDTRSSIRGDFETKLIRLNENQTQQVKLRQEEQELLEQLKSNEFQSYKYDGVTYVSSEGVVDKDGEGVKSARPFITGEKIGDYEGELVYRMPDHLNRSKPNKYVVFKLSNDLSAFRPVRGQQVLQQKRCTITPMTQDRFIIWSNCLIENTDIEIGRNGTNNFCYLNHAKQANVGLTPHPTKCYIPWDKRHDISIEVSALEDIPSHTEMLFNYDKERQIDDRGFKYYSPETSTLTCQHKKRIAEQLNEASSHQLMLYAPKLAKKPKYPRKQIHTLLSKRFKPTQKKQPTLPISATPSCKHVELTKTNPINQSNSDPMFEKLIQDAEMDGVSRETIFCTSNRKFKAPQNLWNRYSRTWNKMQKKKILNRRDLMNLNIALKSKAKASCKHKPTWKKIYHTSRVFAHIGGFDIKLLSRLTPHYLSAFFARCDTTRDKE